MGTGQDRYCLTLAPGMTLTNNSVLELYSVDQLNGTCEGNAPVVLASEALEGPEQA